MALTIRTINPTDLSIKLSLDGNLDNDTVAGFDREIERLLKTPFQTVVLDLEDLQFVSSVGIGVLMKLRARLSRQKTELITINLPPQIQKVLEIMRLVPVMNVFENVEDLDNYLMKVQEKIIDENE